MLTSMLISLSGHECISISIVTGTIGSYNVLILTGIDTNDRITVSSHVGWNVPLRLLSFTVLEDNWIETPLLPLWGNLKS